jgi:hypothetical protein
MAPRITDRRLDLDDIGAEVGKGACGKWSRQILAEIEHPHPVQK